MSVNSYLYLYLDQVVPLSFSYRLSCSFKPVNFLITSCSVLSIALYDDHIILIQREHPHPQYHQLSSLS